MKGERRREKRGGGKRRGTENKMKKGPEMEKEKYSTHKRQVQKERRGWQSHPSWAIV